MTLERLKQYRMMVREVEQLERRIEKYTNLPDRYTTDSVTGSSPDFPFVSRTVVVHGQDQQYREKLHTLVERLTLRRNDALDEILSIESFVEEIKDSEIRQAIVLKYIEGKSWGKVNMELYGYPGRDAPRKMIKRFFEKL